MHKKTRFVASGVVVLLASASLALADVTTQGDEKGDTVGTALESEFDFKSARVAHDGRDAVVHRVGAWEAANFRSVLLYVDSGSDGQPDAYVMKKKGKKAKVYDFFSDEPMGPARYIRVSETAFKFRFNLELFGLPDAYKWRWRTLGTGGGNYDKIPNKGWIRHSLSTGHD